MRLKYFVIDAVTPTFLKVFDLKTDNLLWLGYNCDPMPYAVFQGEVVSYSVEHDTLKFNIIPKGDD